MAAYLNNFNPQIKYSGSYHVTPGFSGAGAVKIKRGYTDEGNLRPGTLEWTINNSDNSWLPSNPESPLYGLAEIGAPAALSVRGLVRGVFEASSFKPDQTADFNASTDRGMRWVDVVASDPLRRIGRWRDISQSAMFGTFSGLSTLTAYAPAEDGRDASNLSLAVGADYAASTGVTFGDTDAPDGATASMLGSATSHVVISANTTASAGWQVFWSFKASALGAAATMFYVRAQSIMIEWQLATGPNITVNIYVSGTLVKTDTASMGTGVDPTNWISYRAKVSQNTTNVRVETAWYQQNDTVVWGITSDGTGTLVNLTSLRIDGNTLVNGGRYAHIGSVAGTTDDLQSFAVLQAFNGYSGETAADRFSRLCTERGITPTVIGTAANTVVMGPQQADTFINQLKEIQDTEDALIYGRRGAFALELRTRRDRINQDPVLALTFPDHFVGALDESLDDIGVRNSVTAKNRDAGSYPAEKATGARSIATVGLYDFTANVSVEDESDLPFIAQWFLARGTLAGSRFPVVTVDLFAHPELETDATTVDIGDRITITGRGPDTLDLQVIGYEETFDGNDRWEIAYTCVPNDPFTAGGEEDGLLQATASTLNAGVTSTATSMVFTTPTDVEDTWSTTNEPYDVMIAGERITVTSMGAASGSGPYTQTATVTRSVNGVVKAQTAGTAVRVTPSIKESW